MNRSRRSIRNSTSDVDSFGREMVGSRIKMTESPSAGAGPPRRVTRGNKSAMKAFADNAPLTDAELDRLGDFLKSSKGARPTSKN